jgi:hypothetical protein
MSFRLSYVRMIAMTLLLTAVGVALLTPASAQAPAAQSTEDQQLEALLSGADLFYKKGFNDGQQRWEYKVAWEQGGETSLITLYIRQWGTAKDGSKITVAYAYSPITAAPEGQELPPAVIKAIVAYNDNLLTGNISAVETAVFANNGMFMKDLTPGALSLYLYELHDVRVNVKKELDKLMAGG